MRAQSIDLTLVLNGDEEDIGELLAAAGSSHANIDQ